MGRGGTAEGEHLAEEKLMRSVRTILAGLLVLGVGLALAMPVFVDDGKEEKVELKDCPEAVQKTIKEQAGDGQIVEIEKETTKDGTVVYEAEVKKSDGKTVDIEVAADGTLIKVEDDDEEDADRD